MKERLVKIGVEPMPMTVAEFGAFFKDEIAANLALVKAAKIPTQYQRRFRLFPRSSPPRASRWWP